MNRAEFINTLDFEVAKNSIVRKLGIKTDEVTIKPYRSGDFTINLRNVSGKVGSLLYGAGKAVIVTDKIKIREHKDSFSYEANVMLNLKSGAGEYKNRIGKITLNNNKFVFHTINDLKARKNKSNEVVDEKPGVTPELAPTTEES